MLRFYRKPVSGHPARLIFILLAASLFLLLPLLSLQSGISGDEPVHHEHAKLVIAWFKSDGSDSAALYAPETNLHYYGQSVDNFACRVHQLLGTQEPWTIRHLISALFGAGTIWLCGLLAIELGGTWAGVLAMLILLLTPRFTGHSFNNLKDVPFAFAYILTILSLIWFIRPLPRLKAWPLAGIFAGTALAISIRAGGLILIPVVLFFTGLQAYLKRTPQRRTNLRLYFKLVLLLVITLSAAWLFALSDWPWARQHPLRAPLEALQAMTRYEVSIRQLFEGELLWSEDLPWYYPLKYLAMTTPIIILAGLFALPWLNWRKQSGILSSVLFASFFPLFWVIVKDSNLYGGIRHLLFILPLIAVLSAAGWVRWSAFVTESLKKKILLAIIMAGLAGPLWHYVQNHPLEYVYFNQSARGMNGAWGNYETDYYYHSLRPALNWLEKHLEDHPSEDPVVVASNFPLKPYLKWHPWITQVVYTPWHQRTKHSWQYGIFVATGIAPSQFRLDRWPPSNSLHNITVNDYPVCTIVEQTGLSSFGCHDAFKAADWPAAEYCFLRKMKNDEGDEMAWLYYGYTMYQQKKTAELAKTTAEMMERWPDWEPVLVLEFKNLMLQQRFEEALDLVKKIRKLNHKFFEITNLEKAALDSIKATMNY